MSIEWRDIAGYEGRYRVSSMGAVFSCLSGKELAQSPDKDGYLHVNLYLKGKGKTHKVHHLVLKAFDRLPLPGEETNHEDGDKSNNALSNLAWATKKVNQQHAYNVLDRTRRGGHYGRVGEKHEGAKTYLVTSPEGKDEQIVGLNQFCREKGLHASTMSQVALGKFKQHKGWTCQAL